MTGCPTINKADRHLQVPTNRYDALCEYILIRLSARNTVSYLDIPAERLGVKNFLIEL